MKEGFHGLESFQEIKNKKNSEKVTYDVDGGRFHQNTLQLWLQCCLQFATYDLATLVEMHP